MEPPDAVIDKGAGLPLGVGASALLIAAARAVESDRPDRLFDDPLAASFVAAGPAEWVWPPNEFIGRYFAIRTRFFDDFMCAAVENGCGQVVMVAAGLDARAYRLGLPPSTRVFEVDVPAILAFKESVLSARNAEPSCQRSVVAVDLRDDWSAALLGAGFRPSQPTAWLLEGILFYLEASQGDQLLDYLSKMSAPGSELALEHINQATIELPAFEAARTAFRKLGTPWKWGTDDPGGLLARHGWQATVHTAAETAVRYQKPVPPFADPAVVGDARAWLVSANRPTP